MRATEWDDCARCGGEIEVGNLIRVSPRYTDAIEHDDCDGDYADEQDGTPPRVFPHHEEVIATFELLKATWMANDPRSNVALFFASYHETFLDMARAVVQERHKPTAHEEIEEAVNALMRQEGWNGHHRHTLTRSVVQPYRDRVLAGERATPQTPDSKEPQ